MARKVSYESSGMGSILPIVLIGGIGYVIYKYFGDFIGGASNLFAPSNHVVDPKTIAAIIPDVTKVTNTPTAKVEIKSDIPLPPNNQESNYAKMGRWINSNLDWFTQHQGLATYDEWNYILGQVGGDNSRGIEDIFPGMDRATGMTMQDYFAGLSKVGIGGGAGLGQILNMEDFFINGPRLLRTGNFR